MKTIAKPMDKVHAEQAYPCLKINKEVAVIVLFSRRNCGVIVTIPKIIHSAWKIGYYSGFWDMNNFKSWYGTVELISEREAGVSDE